MKQNETISAKLLMVLLNPINEWEKLMDAASVIGKDVALFKDRIPGVLI
ncbi:hypothetical protein [Niallia sp. Man26]|nr:hypothetical protein [Niallia sp. Man26]UPO90008.1 hypothetical protein L8T27_024905 [Niallia sp. Man26]